MAEYRKKFISLDLETTHLDTAQGRIMEVGAVECEIFFDERKKQPRVKFGREFNTLVNPEIEPSAAALNLTGIGQSELQSAPMWRDVKPKLADFLGDQILLGHNLSFDLSFLQSQGLSIKNPFLDTLEIAQAFLPLSPSFSLEFLSEFLGIKAETSHRALADSHSAALLLERCVSRFLEFDIEIQKQVKDYLRPSTLIFRDLFIDLPEIKLAGKRERISEKESGVRGKPDFSWFSGSWPHKTIINLPINFNKQQELLEFSAKQKDFPAIIAVSKPLYLNAVPDSQKIYDPQYVLCEKKWDRFKGREDLSDPARRVAIKILLFKTLQNSNNLLALKWSGDEFEYINLLVVESIVCLDHRCEFVDRLYSEKKRTVFMTLKTLFTLTRDWSVNFSETKLLVFDLAEIENWFGESFVEVWNLKKLRTEINKLYALTDQSVSFTNGRPSEIDEILNEADLFFGMLHFVYLKREGEFAQNLLLDQEQYASDRFSKLLHPARKFILKLERLHAFLDNQILVNPEEMAKNFLVLQKQIEAFTGFLKEFFLSPNTQKIYWLKFNYKWVDLNASFLKIDSHWLKFAKQFRTISIIETELPRISSKYFRERLGLQEYEIQKVSLPSIATEKLIVNVYSKDSSLTQIVGLPEKLEGSSMFILPNENQLIKYFEILNSKADFPKKILAYKLSGGIFKLRSVLHKLESEKQPYLFLITTNAALKYFHTFPKSEHLIILRLPFEAPNARMRRIGDNDFVEQVLPRALNMLHTLLSRFVQSPGRGKEVHLLDRRASRDYNHTFLHYFEEISVFTLSNGRNETEGEA